MRARRALAAERFPPAFVRAPMVWQFTSIGSMKGRWIDELRASLSAGQTVRCGDVVALGQPEGGAGGLQLVWPTMGEVRGSLQGYHAGTSIPGRVKSVYARDDRGRVLLPAIAKPCLLSDSSNPLVAGSRPSHTRWS